MTTFFQTANEITQLHEFSHLDSAVSDLPYQFVHTPVSGPSKLPTTSAPTMETETLSPAFLPSNAPTPGPTVPDFSDRPSMMSSQIPPSTMPSTVVDLPECVCHDSYDWTSFDVVCDTHCMAPFNGHAYCYVEHRGEKNPCGVENECSSGVPCRMPVLSPSLFPTTSAPTIEGESASPTALPSEVPTPNSTVADLPECVCQDGYNWSSHGVVCDTHCMNDGAAYCHPGGSLDPCGGETCGANEIRCRMPVYSPSNLPTSTAPTMKAETMSPAVLPSKVPTPRPTVPVSGPSKLPTTSAPTLEAESLSPAFLPSKAPTPGPTISDFSDRPSMMPSQIPPSTMPSTVADLPECVCQDSYDWTSFDVVCDTHCMAPFNGQAYCYVEHRGDKDPCGVENECSSGVPCRMPVFSPSLLPTTSAPTIEGESASPTALPSEAPTPNSTVADLPECVC